MLIQQIRYKAKYRWNVIEFQGWQFSHDLLGSHPFGQHPQNRDDGDAKPPDTRRPAHLVGVDGDAVHA